MNKDLWCTVSDGNQYWFQIFRNATSPKQWYLQIDVLDVFRSLESTLTIKYHINIAINVIFSDIINTSTAFILMFMKFQTHMSKVIKSYERERNDGSIQGFVMIKYVCVLICHKSSKSWLTHHSSLVNKLCELDLWSWNFTHNYISCFYHGLKYYIAVYVLKGPTIL